MPRIEAEQVAPERSEHRALALTSREPVALAQLDAENETELLPQGHPRWAGDGVSVSQRARDLVARLRRVLLRVLRFWDHRVHSIAIDGRNVRIDAAGSYRVE